MGLIPPIIETCNTHFLCCECLCCGSRGPRSKSQIEAIEKWNEIMDIEELN
jgi:hypothetical protein